MSLTHFKAVFPVRIYITQEAMQKRMQEMDIMKSLGEDIERGVG